jgi:hydroxymethylpyrimidine/phosphomethylpyrimidine kinase
VVVLGDGVAGGTVAHLKQVLTIAGSDSGGGAGIQADLKAMSAAGVFGMSVITAITAQNTRAVTAAYDLPIPLIEAQIDAIFEDFEVSAVKTGMLSSSDIVQAVARKLKSLAVENLVVDPVMVSKSGYDLLQADAIESVKDDLIPLARLVTPNLFEAERLTGRSIKTTDDAKAAARAIHRLGCRAVLIKGGHRLDEPATDILFDGSEFTILPGEYIETANTHGTGCTYASAIAAKLALGNDLIDAVRTAKIYITEAIRHGLAIGHGHGPTDHFFAMRG